MGVLFFRNIIKQLYSVVFKIQIGDVTDVCRHLEREAQNLSTTDPSLALAHEKSPSFLPREVYDWTKDFRKDFHIDRL